MLFLKFLFLSLSLFAAERETQGHLASWDDCARLLSSIRPKVDLINSPQASTWLGQTDRNLALPTEKGVLLKSYEQVQAYLQQEAREDLKADLGSIRPEDFQAGEVFYVNAVGLSHWEKKDLNEWLAWAPRYRRLIRDLSAGKKMRSFVLMGMRTPPRLALGDFLGILKGSGAVPGLNDEQVTDFRYSYFLAKEMQRRMHPSKDVDLEKIFEMLYAGYVQRGDHPGSRVPEDFDAYQRRLKLPFTLQDQELSLSEADAFHLLTLSLRFQMMAHLVRSSEGQLVPQFYRRELYFASMFPELMPVFRAVPEATKKQSGLSARQLQDLVLSSFALQDGVFGIHYDFRMGEVHPLPFDLIVFEAIKNDLKPLGISAAVLNIQIVRRLDAQERPSDMKFVMALQLYNDSDEPYDGNMDPEKRVALEKIFSDILASFSGFDGMQVQIRPMRGANRKANFELLLQGPSVSVYDQIHFYLVLSELRRYQRGAWPD